MEEEVWKFGSYIFRHGLLFFPSSGLALGAFRLFYGGSERFVVFDRGWLGRKRILKGGAIKQGSSVIGGEIFPFFPHPLRQLGGQFIGLYWGLVCVTHGRRGGDGGGMPLPECPKTYPLP